jgi:hypothetical protein
MHTALARLRIAESPHRRELVDSILAHALARPWGDVVDADWVTDRLVASMSLAGHDPHLRALVVDVLEETRGRLSETTTPPRDVVPDEVIEAILAVSGQPWSPSEELTFRLINHSAMRSMLKEVLTAALTKFANRARTLDQGVLGGIGSRAVKRGRGLLGGSLGNAAGNLVGAVRGEVEAALEGRIKETVTHATEDAVRTIARWLSDPAHADTLAAMRTAGANALLDTPTERLVAEADAFDVAELVDIVLGALRGMAARDDLREQIAPEVARAWQHLADRTLGEWLDNVDARDSWTEALAPVLDEELRQLFDTEEFAAWWQRLHS